MSPTVSSSGFLEEDFFLLFAQGVVTSLGDFVENLVDTLLLGLTTGVEIFVTERTAALMGDIIL